MSIAAEAGSTGLTSLQMIALGVGALLTLLVIVVAVTLVLFLIRAAGRQPGKRT
jgi:hypothetical protein